METKPFYLSKTVWATFITLVVGIYEVVVKTFPQLNLPGIDSPLIGSVLVFLGGLGLYGRITANTVVTK